MGSLTSAQVRLALADDADDVAEVLRKAFEPHRPKYTSAAFAATTPAPDVVRERLLEGPVWVAARAGAILGTVSVVARGSALYLRSMAVVPTARGLGIGHALLRKAEAHARSNGHASLVLSTTPFLDDAIRLYERAGFKRTGEGPHDLCGTPLVTMRKALAAEPIR